jgi:uncharacterized protein
MITRRFGRTQIQVPLFSTGGMRYQQDWKSAVPEELDSKVQSNVQEIIEKSLDLGLRHIETARGYGTSEYHLGLAFRNIKREDYILQTKVPPKESPDEFRENLDKSLELLGVEHVDLLGIHGINNEETLDWAIRKGGCMEVVREYQEKGRIGKVGFSTHGQRKGILAAIESNEFDYVNLHYYYIDQGLEPCLQAAHERDMGIFIISPSDKGGMLYKAPEKLKKLTEPYSPMVFNDLFCLRDPRIHTLSLGAARPSDFDEHMKAAEIFAKGDFSEVNTIEARLDHTLKGTVGESLLSDIRNLPDWDEVPHGVNLRVILRLWSIAKAFDMVEYSKMRYNLIGNGGHWFPGDRPSEESFGELKDFLKDFKEGEALYEALHEASDLLKGEEKKRLSQS